MEVMPASKVGGMGGGGGGKTFEAGDRLRSFKYTVCISIAGTFNYSMYLFPGKHTGLADHLTCTEPCV